MHESQDAKLPTQLACKVFHLGFSDACVELCGCSEKIQHSGQSYEIRRGWIRSRLEVLASSFAIDC